MLLNIKTNNTKLSMTDTLSDYYSDVQKFNLLDEKEERALFEELRYNESILKLASKEKDYILAKECEDTIKHIREKIANANLRFVISVARVYGTDSDISDLISEGNLGLMEAIDRYDVTKKNKFSTFAVYYIRRQINLYRQEDSEAIRKNNISKTFHIASKVTNMFMQENGREPSSDELMTYINELYPNLMIKDYNDLTAIKISSIDSIGDKDDEDDNNIGNIIEYNERSASYNLYDKTSEDEYRRTMISSMLRTINEEDARILKMYFGIDTADNESMNFSQIAIRLNVDENVVKKSVTNSIKKLKEKYAERLSIA